MTGARLGTVDRPIRRPIGKSHRRGSERISPGVSHGAWLGMGCVGFLFDGWASLRGSQSP